MDSRTKYLNPANCRFSLSDTGMLRAEIDEKFTCTRVVLRRLFPIRHPLHFIAVKEDGGEELGIIEDLSLYDRHVRRMLEKELEIYYSVPVITEIRGIDHAFGFMQWDVETSRGPHAFHVKGRSENIAHAAARELFITDIHNCRYHIPDTGKLSRNSQQMLDHLL